VTDIKKLELLADYQFLCYNYTFLRYNYNLLLYNYYCYHYLSLRFYCTIDLSKF
jgi:hypothetical protein